MIFINLGIISATVYKVCSKEVYEQYKDFKIKLGKNIMKKRISSLIFTVVMTFIMLPITASADKWVEAGGGYKYQYTDGSYAKQGWLTIKNDRYYIQEDGTRKTGWLHLTSGKYYLNAKTAKLTTGNAKVDGDLCIFDGKGKLINQISSSVIKPTPKTSYPQYYNNIVATLIYNIGIINKGQIEKILSDNNCVIRSSDTFDYVLNDGKYYYAMILDENDRLSSVAIALLDDVNVSTVILLRDGEFGILAEGPSNTFLKIVKSELLESISQLEKFLFVDKRFDEPYNSPDITFPEYMKIRAGMTYDEVVSVIGGYGERLSSVSSYGHSMSMYSWDGVGKIGASAVITFSDGKVYSQAEYGLSLDGK